RGAVGLAIEALGHRGIAADLRVQDLDRHAALQPGVTALEDRPHPADAEQGLDLVAIVDRRTDQRLEVQMKLGRLAHADRTRASKLADAPAIEYRDWRAKTQRRSS